MDAGSEETGTDFGEESRVEGKDWELYDLLFNKFIQEGEFVWRRFFIFLLVESALFGAWVYAPKLHGWQIGIYSGEGAANIVIAIFGLFFSVWAYFSTISFWWWHNWWRTVLIEIEQSGRIASLSRFGPLSRGNAAKPYATLVRRRLNQQTFFVFSTVIWTVGVLVSVFQFLQP